MVYQKKGVKENPVSLLMSILNLEEENREIVEIVLDQNK